jgi:hypothetical protein
MAGSSNIGKIMALWNLVIQWLTGSWNDAGTQALKDAINILSTTPWPDLSEGWFKLLWNSIFGLALIVSIFAIMFHAAIFMFRAREGYSVYGALGIFGRTFLTGAFGLVLVYAAIVFSSYAIQVLTLLGNHITSTKDWTTAFQAQTGSENLQDIWGPLGLAWLGLSAGELLSVQAYLSNGAIYIFALYSLITTSLGQTRFMQWIRSLFQAALWTAVFSRVLQIGFLVFMSGVVHNIVNNDVQSATDILIAVVGADVLPLIVFVGLTWRAVVVEGKMDIRRNMRDAAEHRGAGLSEAQIIERRNQRVNGLKTAAIGAAAAGAAIGTEKLVSKAVAPIITKLSGIAHPAAPFVIMGVQAVASKVTGSVHKKISSTSERLGARRI